MEVGVMERDSMNDEAVLKRSLLERTRSVMKVDKLSVETGRMIELIVVLRLSAKYITIGYAGRDETDGDV